MKMQYLESLQAFVTTEIRIWDPSQPPIEYFTGIYYLVSHRVSFIVDTLNFELSRSIESSLRSLSTLLDF